MKKMIYATLLNLAILPSAFAGDFANWAEDQGYVAAAACMHLPAESSQAYCIKDLSEHGYFESKSTNLAEASQLESNGYFAAAAALRKYN